MIRLSLKNKLLLGFAFLFLMILLIWGVGSFFIYDLSSRSAAMLKENYQTVESTKYLLQSIDEIKNQQLRALAGDESVNIDSIWKTNELTFQEHLLAVENNITETGEKEVVHAIKTSYNEFLLTFDRLKAAEETMPALYFHQLLPVYTQTRKLIVDLWDMNMTAISHKNKLLRSTAHRAFVILSFIGAICFAISIFFLFRYPGNIARPIRQLTQGITEIANRDYSKRLDFHSHDELGELAAAFNTMAAKLDEFEHSNLSELLFEKKRIDTIINNMNDVIIGLNEKKEIIFSNHYACRIISLSEAELLGQHAAEIAKSNQVFYEIVNDVIEGKSLDHHEFKPVRLVINNEADYFAREVLNVNITRTGEHDAIHVGKVIVLKNITRYLEQNEAKTNFIATISHELKTPIASLRLNLKLLDDSRVGTLNYEQKTIVDALRVETNKMLSITSELLDLAQVESGNIRFYPEAVSLDQLLEIVEQSVGNKAHAQEIELHFGPASGMPKIYADRDKTAWVLVNLINNAIQYSAPHTRVDVSVDARYNELIITINDQGIGIPPEHQPRVFEKFFRVPGSEQQGTGLGLAICKEFVLKQNGRIWFESEPGKGSSFHVGLPVYKG